jgi:hypothetical protein
MKVWSAVCTILKRIANLTRIVEALVIASWERHTFQMLQAGDWQ